MYDTMKSNIRDVSEAYMCSSCGACSAICPVDAIRFKFTNIGRLYADVDSKKCINCGLCRKVCPSLDEQDIHSTFDDAYLGEIKDILVGRCSDERLFRNAQSGGACTATIKYLFTTGKIDAAIVCGMEVGNPPVVSARIITASDNLEKIQKSCYTPVELLSILKKIKDFKSVAVVGLPCQIQGIESLMKMNRFNNISYRLGLICDRTLSNTIMEVFGSLSHMSPDYFVVWRHKLLISNNLCFQYQAAPVSVSSADNKVRIYPNTYRFLLKDIFTAPRCWVCYDKLNTFADIVYGDPWLMSDVDEENGSSLVITRTPKGKTIIDEMMKSGELTLSPRPIEQLLKGQHIEHRKTQMAVYSRAICSLPIKIDSYLYRQQPDWDVPLDEIKEASQMLNRFRLRENMSKSQIIRLAKIHIYKHLFMAKLHIPGIIHRIKNIINR